MYWREEGGVNSDVMRHVLERGGRGEGVNETCTGERREGGGGK